MKWDRVEESAMVLDIDIEIRSTVVIVIVVRRSSPFSLHRIAHSPFAHCIGMDLSLALSRERCRYQKKYRQSACPAMAMAMPPCSFSCDYFLGR